MSKSISTRIQTSLTSLSNFLTLIHENTSLPTILSLASLIQLLFLLFLPRYVAALPAVLYLGHKIITGSPTPANNPYLRAVNHGKYIARLPSDGEADDSSNNDSSNGQGQIVCFIVGAQVNHPLGILAPGFKELGGYFGSIWDAAALDPAKSGYLHHTKSLTLDPDDSGRVVCSISYWRSLEQLQRFAAQGIHRDAMKWWGKEKGAMPHVGIFHETYVCAERNWENVYENMGTVGMGGIKGGLQSVNGKKGGLGWRMGRE